MENTKITLLPCPFCGGPAKLVEIKGNLKYYMKYPYIFCENRQCASLSAPTTKKVVDAWNTRN